MSRYESGTGSTRRFWEIRVSGNTLQTRNGRVGSDGRLLDPKVYKSPAEAQKEAAKRIAGKLKNGFELVDDDIAGQAENPALAEAIRDNPDDPGAYLVYGDWLQAQGDKRGQLATLQQRLSLAPEGGDGADPLTDKERKTETKLRKLLAPSRLFKLTGKKRSKKRVDSGYSQLSWRYGFIDSARVARNSDRPPHTIRELTATLLSHPSAQVLRSLTIGPLAVSGENDYGPVIAEICAARPTSIRELFIADFDIAEHAPMSSVTLGDVSPLYAVLPRLDTLHLRAGTLDLGMVEIPTLRSLTVTTELFEERALRAIADASWPHLAHLHLEPSGSALPSAGLAAIGDAARMTALRHLALVNTREIGDMWRGVLRKSPLLERLRVLDLSHGDLGDQDCEALLAQRHRLEHLDTLNLESNFLSDEAVAELKGLCPDVRCAGQRPPTSGGTALTDQQITEFAPDGKSLMAARKIARPKQWSSLGILRDRWLGGFCQGSSLYQVYVDVEDMESGCTCPSQKYPCKHAIALLLLAQTEPIPNDLPSSWIDEVESGRYDDVWE